MLISCWSWSSNTLAKNWLIGKDPDSGKDWRWEEKATTEDEMVGWHHWLDGNGFEWALGVGDGQGSLACCSPGGRKELDTTEWLNWTEDRKHHYQHHLHQLHRCHDHHHNHHHSRQHHVSIINITSSYGYYFHHYHHHPITCNIISLITTSLSSSPRSSSSISHNHQRHPYLIIVAVFVSSLHYHPHNHHHHIPSSPPAS